MGWFVGGPWKEPAVPHPGDAADSSSLMVLLPRRNMAVVTLVNASNELAVPPVDPQRRGHAERRARVMSPETLAWPAMATSAAGRGSAMVHEFLPSSP